jgi:hypothetical protein
MSVPDPSGARESSGGHAAPAAATAGINPAPTYTMAASGASSSSAVPITVQSPSHAAAAGLTATAGLTASTGPVGSTDGLPMYSTSTGDIAAASGSRGTGSAGDPSALRLSSYNPWTPQVCRYRSSSDVARLVLIRPPFTAHINTILRITLFIRPPCLHVILAAFELTPAQPSRARICSCHPVHC